MDNCKNQNRPPRGKTLMRIERRERSRMLSNLNDEWSGTDFTIAAKITPSPTIQRFQIKTASIGDLEIIKNGGWLESE